ncbi:MULTISPECIES: DUF3696 domain-containing protein [unclassified Exiguobacterium]|uniref:DUF3696 domain-containing protein n=1 Tax=unclassified Exiguobacterium TaxID=2644629 RepID=UPI001BE70C4B|nr:MULTISPECIES: DUF3696 domain-containing protein [unclassified Exiguobacterium]
MINTLYCKNFKCYLSTEIDFQQFTVISGKNSSGKSTIIQAILLYYASLNSNKVNLHNIFNLNLVGQKELVCNKQMDEDFFEISINSNAFTYKELVLNERSVLNNISLVEKQPDFDDHSIIYLGADRTLSSHQIESIHGDGYVPTPTNSFLADYVFINDNALKSDTIRNKISDCLIKLGFVSQSFEVIKGGRNYQLKIDNTDIEHVGVGIKYTIPILLSVISNQNSVIIIENPEIHIHPSAQVTLMLLLLQISKENNNQLIIETHSDHILNALRVGIKSELVEYQNSQILFVNEDSEVNSIDIDSKGRLGERHDGFFDEIEKQLKVLLW